jgi:hypothetical protein
MVNIDKRIETIEKYVTGVDNIGFLKMDKTVTIGVGERHMDGKDTVAVKVETDIL